MYNTNQFEKMEAQFHKTSLGIWLCQAVEGRVNQHFENHLYSHLQGSRMPRVLVLFMHLLAVTFGLWLVVRL